MKPEKPPDIRNLLGYLAGIRGAVAASRRIRLFVEEERKKNDGKLVVENVAIWRQVVIAGDELHQELAKMRASVFQNDISL